MNLNKLFHGNSFIKWKKPMNWIGYIILIVILLAVIGLSSVKILTDYIWMDSLGFEQVFTTTLGSKIVLGAIGFVLFAAGTFITLYWILQSYLRHFDRHQLPKILLTRKWIMLIMLGISIFIGLFGSMLTQGFGWERALKLIHYASFEQTDPYFNLDVSFYMFILPFLKFVVSLLLSLTIFFLLIEIGAYSVFHMYRLSRFAQLHLGITLAVIGLLLAGNHLLAPYETLLTSKVNLFQDSVIHGLSYTDKVINIPKAYVLAFAAVAGSVWMIIALIRGKLRSMVTPAAVYIALLLVGQGASAVVQNFIVSPNEFAKEGPYLKHNLTLTRAAYDLDKVKEKEHPGNYSLSEAMIDRNKQTIDNIRMNDARPLLEVYNQLQTFRTYYKFNDVDIDRYQIDGDYEQVFLGSRELSTEDLPDQAKTWVNRYLRYTHGYGVAMSHVNQVTEQGQPEYMMKNLPPEGVLDIKRPQIYFGEESYQNVIVNSKVDEFDYPSGDENEETRFEADSGIPLKGIKRLLFALNEGSFRMFVSDQITDESQLLDTRNIMDRIKRIAPFFSYDKDPYIVVRDDGTLVWIVDAYLTAERYPYAEPYQGDSNYIRNPVKVSVDAYTGEVKFYVVQPDDPLMQTYQNIFPQLFTTDIPEDIQAHFRYPEKLFKVQASMYGTYHMKNLEVFYNREDFWQFPTEKYFNEDIEMEPYYMTMKLQEEDQEEFILMMPYTPKKRQNMIAWMGVRNDGDHYGELFVYRFPKQKNIYGPQQIENRINQDSDISKQLNLWSQGGSDVIRGNLLAVPIEDTLLYVEPIYIESSNATSLPEVKRVVLAYGDKIVMEKDFKTALDSMLDLIDPKRQKDGKQDDKSDANKQEEPAQPLTKADEQLQEFADLFDAYQKALSDGNWEEAGKLMTEMESKLKEYK
ncbi:membrane protein [Lentibacillus populi]|uniref:UPF0182 protein GCM10011409_32500 n=2 Tax=Bacillales TaxID=1385 RepID=A0A9W5TZT1_9BACI|nr:MULTISPECIES: UPF0182 family protein [Bacillaceae]GGB52448.1 membrane protein [Lentibacillus populi]